MIESFKRFVRVWWNAAGESVACLSLGMRDTLSPRLMAVSSLLCIVSTVIWTLVYYHYFSLLSDLFIPLSVIGAAGLVLGGFQGFFTLTGAGAAANNVAMSITGGVNFIVTSVQALLVAAAIIAAVYVIAYLFLVTTTIRVATPHLIFARAMDKVLRRYPGGPATLDEGPLPSSRIDWKKVVFFLALLCIPMVAAVLMVMGVCYFNVRLIYARAARSTGLRSEASKKLVVRWRPLLILGLLLLLLLVIPILNLLVPALMCTSVLHLVLRDNIAKLSAKLDTSETAGTVSQAVAT